MLAAVCMSRVCPLVVRRTQPNGTYISFQSDAACGLNCSVCAGFSSHCVLLREKKVFYIFIYFTYFLFRLSVDKRCLQLPAKFCECDGVRADKYRSDVRAAGVRQREKQTLRTTESCRECENNVTDVSEPVFSGPGEND